MVHCVMRIDSRASGDSTRVYLLYVLQRLISPLLLAVMYRDSHRYDVDRVIARVLRTPRSIVAASYSGYDLFPSQEIVWHVLTVWLLGSDGLLSSLNSK